VRNIGRGPFFFFGPNKQVDRVPQYSQRSALKYHPFDLKIDSFDADFDSASGSVIFVVNGKGGSTTNFYIKQVDKAP